MKCIVPLVAILLVFSVTGFSQNVFNAADPVVRYNSGAAYASAERPDTNVLGLQKWVATLTNGVSTGSGAFDNNSFKAYYLYSRGTRMSFRVKFPKSYDSTNPTKKWPVMLFLHGAGEAACNVNGGLYNNEKQLVHGGQVFMDRVDNNQFDGFLLYPQLRSKTSSCSGEWGLAPNSNYAIVIDMLDSLIKYSSLDIDRVFVDGLSGGGVGCWNIAEKYPTRIAKIAPTSAAGLPLSYPAFVHIPIWLATGAKDSNPSPEMALYSDNNVNAVGGSIRRSLYADLGHSSWYRHWAEPDFVPFMNDLHKANPLIFFNRNEFCPDSAISTRIGITGGFHSYEWQKDSVTIATKYGTGANTVLNSSAVASFTGNEITVKTFGSYRVRFRRTSTGPWSEWSPKPAVIKSKSVTQAPPIAVAGIKSKTLPSLDGNTKITLQMPPNYLNYQWVRTTDNALVSNAQVFEAPVGTYKARFSEPYGCGALYSPIFKVVNAKGTPKPEAAKNLSISALTQTVLRLDWSDNPNAGTNETGFEIYRSTKTGGPYTLIKITAPDVSTFQDSSLVPNTTYYYVVRSVSETGAAAGSEESSAKTEIDNQAPTAPTELEYRGSTSASVNLRWKASTDNAGLSRYDIYANGAKLYSTTGLSFTVANLDSVTAYTFVVKAVDKAGNVSSASNQVTAYTHHQGLNYKYYHGAFNTLPDFSGLTPVKVGITDTVYAAGPILLQQDNYAFLWEGRIYIPVTANYIFETNSDDGSRLYIDVPYSYGATPLVDNDGAHGATIKTGTRYLTQGYHTIAISFSEIGGDALMGLYWSNNAGLARESIPKNFFATDEYSGISSVIAPSLLVATPVAFNKVNLTWTDNSSDETGFEIVRSTTLAGPYTSVFTSAANAVSYSDSGLTANTRYFYRIRAINATGGSPYVYTEANWKLNNSYADENSGVASLALVPASTSFSTTSKIEGTHAVVFDNSDNISFNDGASGFPSLGIYSQRTVSVWIKPTSLLNKRMIFEFGDNNNGLGLRINNGMLDAGVASGGVRESISLVTFSMNPNWKMNDWNHLAVVYNKNSLKLYLNGVAVASNYSLSFEVIGNSTNISKLGQPSSTATTSNVFNDNSYSSYGGSMDNISVIRAALTESDIQLLKNNSSVLTSVVTLAAPAPPAAPDALTANVLSTDRISLTWNDNSTDETAFEIWRATGDKSNNRKITSVNSGSGSSMTFTDTALFANVTYYYTVRATGAGGASAYTTEVTAKTLNTKPVLKKVLNFTMRYGTTFVLPVSATDVDGDALSFSFLSLPNFATVENVSNGNINISFSPPVTKRGSYSITVYVNDGNNGKDTSFFSLVVNTNDVPVMSAVQDVVVNEGGSFNLPVSGTDNNGTAQMAWTFDGLPSFATFTKNNDGTGVLAFLPTYASSGVYNLTIFLNDGYGAWTSRSLVITVNEKDPEETLQFDFRSTSNPEPLWNNVNIVDPSFSHGTILSTKSNPTEVALSLTKGSISFSTQGSQSATNTGVYPNSVMKDLMIWGFNTGNNLSDTIIVKVSGLDATKLYGFTFHSGYSLTATTQFKIGAQSVSLNGASNTSLTASLSNVLPNASGEVFVTMIGDAAITRGGVLNAMVIKQNYTDDGSKPAKPINISGIHTQNAGVALTWTDVAFNELGYRVYRSLNRVGEYTVLNEGALNKDTSNYNDQTVAPETTYYYYVAGYNASGTGASSDTIKVITGNNSPVITSTDVYVKTDAVDNSDFTVTDDAGDAVTVELESKPSFVTLQNTGGSNYRLVSAPNTNNIGWFTVKVKAMDNKGAITRKNIMVTVSDKNTRSVFINFGSASKTAAAPWNNFTGVKTSGASILNLKDEKNLVTAFGLTINTSWSGVSDLGHITGNNSGVYPDSVMQSGLSDIGGQRGITISGLNNAMKYNIVIVGSRNEGKPAAIEYVSGTTKDTLDAKYNTNMTANLNGLTPVGGQITFTAQRLPGTTVSYLNAVVIEEYNPSLTILNPLNLYVEAIDRSTTSLSWSDRTADEDASQGYSLERASDSLFTQNLVSIGLPANTSAYKEQGLKANTQYWYRVRAKSGGGAYSDYSNRVRIVTPASIVYVNFNYTLDNADYPWNNTFAAPTFAATFNNLTNQAGAVSGMSLELTKIFNGEFTAGVSTANNSGAVPDQVLASNYWLDNTQESQFVLHGLNHSRRYSIGFLGSAGIVGWFEGNYTATYTINGRTVYLNSWMNSSKIVYIDNVAPDENGDVTLNFSTTAAAMYGFNAGIIIRDYTDPLATSGGMALASTSTLAEITEVAVATDKPLAARATAATTAKMYPNPFTDFINMDFSNTSADNNISMEVYDLSGRISYSRNFGKLPKGNHTITLNGVEAGMNSTGVYIITLSVNGKAIQAGKVIRTQK